MNVDSILISEYATLTDESALTVIRTFNGLSVKTFPTRIGLMALSIIIHGHASERGVQHHLEIRLINARRETIATVVNVDFAFKDYVPPGGVPLRYVHVHRFVNIEFRDPGAYAFEAYIDDTYHAGASFFLLEASETDTEE